MDTSIEVRSPALKVPFMKLNETISHLENSNFDFALQGVVPNSLAAMEQVPQTGGRLVHLTVSSRGLRACVLTHGQHVVHAEVRSAEIQVTAERTGCLVWTGEAAIRAMAILCNRPVEIEIVATSDPVAGHAPNTNWPLTRALLEMALSIDEGKAICTLPCALEA